MPLDLILASIQCCLKAAERKNAVGNAREKDSFSDLALGHNSLLHHYSFKTVLSINTKMFILCVVFPKPLFPLFRGKEQ